MKLIRTYLSVILICAIFVGCTTFSSPDSICMKTNLVSSLSRTPLYPILEDDPRASTISVVKTTCVSAKEEAPAGKMHIEIDLALNIPEARKTSGKTKKAIFPVFVALLDQQDNVLDRLDEKVEVTITDKSLSHTHKITYRPPEGIDVSSKEYRLLVGFHGTVMASHSTLTHHRVKKVASKTGSKGNN